MHSAEELIEILIILKKYKPNKILVSGFHDEIAFFHLKPDEVSEEDDIRLKELGCHVEYECYRILT